ncbi:hypothetical protein UAY_03068 [Enterococcus moraviensis ATCC BAA-383]|uniref:Ferrous iron transporter FeoA domain-containing protein n=1 Tax=Enterococcus moraviensis ATCC BAA-383 TaxID=1158609 RepID=R2QLS0_9ENTE|nr:hypothetical protein [Enterococcus moraviensis]EOH96158.1 hypothetical protein UAY_03068 [Enterococcus moraviensis ATCC BAA-383]EOT66130.1 hypothetical protein I586_02401 [Enterococcus moraviensis ATCC BAA-383]OJG65728.1 hypothetical protein RV09_GL001068 [Enterococcus moraviensis]
MEYLTIKKSNTRDTATLAGLGMLAYRIFPDSECINIQLLSGAQEESTIPFKDGERFRLRNSELCLIIVD